MLVHTEHVQLFVYAYTLTYAVMYVLLNLSLFPLKHFLDLPEDDPFLLDTLKLLREFTKNHVCKKTVLQLEVCVSLLSVFGGDSCWYCSHNDSISFRWFQIPSVSSKLAHLVCSLNIDLQSLCLAVFLNLVTRKDEE